MGPSRWPDGDAQVLCYLIAYVLGKATKLMQSRDVDCLLFKSRNDLKIPLGLKEADGEGLCLWTGRGCVCGPGGIRSVWTSGPLLKSCLALHVTGPAWESPSQRSSGDGDGGEGRGCVSDIWYFFVLPM